MNHDEMDDAAAHAESEGAKAQAENEAQQAEAESRVTFQDLHADLDRLGETALRVKAERDELIAAVKNFLDAYDAEIVDVEHFEFTLEQLRAAVTRAERHKKE